MPRVERIYQDAMTREDVEQVVGTLLFVLAWREIEQEETAAGDQPTTVEKAELRATRTAPDD